MDTQTTKELLNAPQRGEIILYQTADGRTKIDVKLENETVWLTQAQLCLLFDKSKSTISEHISNIFKEGELMEESVVRNFRTTAADGKPYDTKLSVNCIYWLRLDICRNILRFARNSSDMLEDVSIY